jgi:hypothetical protein
MQKIERLPTITREKILGRAGYFRDVSTFRRVLDLLAPADVWHDFGQPIH